LVFKYTIQSGETDINGISIGADSLAFNSGTIRDASGNYATITHSQSSPLHNDDYMVDTTAPTVVDNVSMSGPTGSWNAGHTYSATATFSESVIVDGNPTLTIVVGSTGRAAAYTSGSGSTALIFQYTTVGSDSEDSTDGISIDEDALDVPVGSTIRDQAGNIATDVTHDESDPHHNPGYKVK
jgi:hypothetical protein